MGQIKLEGALIAGPPTATDILPASITTYPLAFSGGNSKSFSVGTGVLTRTLNSPNAYVEFPELGTNAAVSRGNFFVMRCDAAMMVKITTDDGIGGDEVAVVPVQGLAVLEFPDAKYLKKLEVKGSGKLEYLISGTQ